MLLGNQNADEGSSYSTSTNETFIVSEAKENSDIVDFIHYNGDSNNASIASPDGEGVAEFSVFDLDMWDTLNSTRFKTTEVNFEDISDDALIVTAADGADLKEVTDLSVDDVIAFVTGAGKKGVFKVSALTEENITLEVTVQK